MRAEVTLRVTEGAHKGKEFRFDRHDIFVFGRSVDCHFSLPEDPYISANHFLIEVNPPYCALKDLGSKNGTRVNGVRAGRREAGEAPASAAERARPVRVGDGDRVKAGQTEFAVTVRVEGDCAACGKSFPMPAEADWAAETERCPDCRRKGAAKPTATLPPPVPAPAPAPAAAKEPGYMTKFLAGLPPAAPEAPLEFPGYDAAKKISEGGMGAVYLARRKADGRAVVVKVIKAQARRAAEGQVKAFLREIRTAQGLRHPNIVEFYEDGCAGDVPFFAMEYCPGGSVETLMAGSGGRLPLETAAEIMLQALDGLAYAHARDFIHRDLKPANILLAGEGTARVAKVADFGLAKNFALAGLSAMTGDEVGGTPYFMPKEQLLHYRWTKPVSDVFSMGASLYNMLTGAYLYDKTGDWCQEVLLGRVVPVRERGVALPDQVVAVIERATAVDFERRTPTAREFRDALAAAVGR